MEEGTKDYFKLRQKTLEITPKTKYLSPTELTALRKHDEVSVISAGLKKTKVENTTEEQNELEKLYANLERELCRSRIERLGGRTVGVWDPKKKLVRVERKDGKFTHFGFNIKGQLYLEFYEALFLLEVNRLQLEYNSTIVSIEQAYLLLMGEQHSSKYHEYLVYSNLTRTGYILVKHKNIHFQKHQINSEADCVWAVLESKLQDEPVADYIKKTSYYPKVKQNFDALTSKIKNPSETGQSRQIDEETFEQDLKFSEKIKPNKKRKANEESRNEWVKAKKHCNYAQTVLQHSLVEFLKEEEDFKQFKETFKQLDLVQLKLNDESNQDEKEHMNENEIEDEEDDDIKVTKLHINFDVYLHNEGFRKSSPHLPNFRVSILQPQQRFPSHDEIFATHRQQINSVPLLIVSVNDSKQMQAFLYYISR